MTVQIDGDKILDDILALDISPTAKEAGAALVDAWLQKFYVYDRDLEILAVELGFMFWADQDTVVIGVQDMIARDKVGIVGNEWKSAKEPKKNKDGSDSAWWNEDRWLEEISNGPQLAIYALALHQGIFYEKGNPRPIRFNVPNPRIRVRAAVKSTPVRFWPSDPVESPGVYQFSTEALLDVQRALSNKGTIIRTLRHKGVTPWQLTGKHCFTYNKECPFFELWCEQHVHPVDALTGGEKYALFDQSDPAAELALPHIPPDRLHDPNLVVLSASQYSLASDCLERYRIINSGSGKKSGDIALETGTAMHAGVAAFYRQLRGESNKTLANDTNELDASAQ